MDRLTSTQLRALLDVVRGCYACHEQEAFVTYLLGAVPTLIPSEVTSYAKLDLGTGAVGNDTKVMPADARFSEDTEIFAAHASQHPITTYCQQVGDGRAVKISDFLTQSQFHRLGLYQEFFRRKGVEDQMAASLAGHWPLNISITLHRGRRSFSERERLLLNLLRPHLAQAHANVQAITAIRQAVEASGQAVVVLSREGQVRLMTPRAHRCLTAYFGPIGTEQLPEALRAWLSHQEAALDRTDDVPPPREPLRVEREGGCLLVRHLCEAEQCLLLLEERPTVRVPTTFKWDGLTRREAEVLQWVAQGKTNGEIGCILGMSPRTVEKHLENIFKKLGVETRMAAVTLALSWRSDG